MRFCTDPGNVVAVSETPQTLQGGQPAMMPPITFSNHYPTRRRTTRPTPSTITLGRRIRRIFAR
jgi:hypothetical protein